MSFQQLWAQLSTAVVVKGQIIMHAVAVGGSHQGNGGTTRFDRSHLGVFEVLSDSPSLLCRTCGLVAFCGKSGSRRGMLLQMDS